jgi:hypothetical protein
MSFYEQVRKKKNPFMEAPFVGETQSANPVLQKSHWKIKQPLKVPNRRNKWM